MEPIGHNRCNVPNEEEVLEATPADVGYHSDHTQNTPLSVQFYPFCTSPRDIFASSSVYAIDYGFYTKLQMKLMLCAMYCGAMKQHSQGVE
jgi:hypothetical protein